MNVPNLEAPKAIVVEDPDSNNLCGLAKSTS